MGAAVLGATGVQVTAPAAPSTLLTGLIAWYKMDEASGNRLDSVGVRTLTEGPGTLGSQAGVIGSAASFVGDGNGLGRLSSVLTSLPLSLSMWFKLTFDPTEGVERTLFMQLATATIRQRLYTDGGGNLFWAGAGGAGSLSFDITGIWTNWVHVVVTHDGVTAKLFLNGVYQTSDSSGATFSGVNRYFIGTTATQAASMSGGIDLVGFWNRAVTSGLNDGDVGLSVTASSEIGQLYNAGAARDYPF